MKTIKICWLFNEVLDLYGDGGNILAIVHQLDADHIPYDIVHKSIYDSIDFNEYDMYYMGPGKDRNIVEVARHLLPYKHQIADAVQAGKLFLIIGNAQLLFGRSFTYEKETIEGLNLFNYSGEMNGKVFINDYIMSCDLCADKLYGFINRTSTMEESSDEALFKVVYSQNDIGKYEGKHRNNYFSTWALGPLLAKNPQFLNQILNILVDSQVIMNDELMKQAYIKTMEEFDI